MAQPINVIVKNIGLATLNTFTFLNKQKKELSLYQSHFSICVKYSIPYDAYTCSMPMRA